ncbi:MAG: hypothetical protein H7Y39_07700 [Nitrospiraceae bacterium]|nr:hypothetical protein [Nitrospiraceae bacterium]
MSGGPGGGPANQGSPPAHTLGNATNGRTVFRSETFGNERFWTDAIRLPAGVVAAKVTPLQALGLGLHVDIEALDAATVAAVAAELLLDPTGKTSKILNDPATTVALINANAVIGLPAKDTNGDGVIDISKGDKVGASCALCHADTDGSALNVPNGGSIGKRRDGGASHTLDFGTLLSIGTNSRAYYPALQLALAANGGKTLGRAPTGLTETSTEAQVDAYLKNKSFYPVGMFDDSVDGNGDPMHNMPLFRQDLAHPYGSEGAIAKLDNFSNLVYTALLDPTTLTTPGGRAFLQKLGGDAGGKEIADDYALVLAATGVTGPFPFIQAGAPGNPALAGTEEFPLGVRVDETKLNDMNAYLFALAAPAGKAGDPASVERGRTAFQSNSCTNCHNVDQGKFVPTFIVPMKTIFPGDNPIVLLPQRTPPLNPILDTPGVFFDDKMAVVNASLRGLERGTALPLLLDLDRKPVFLHDDTVPSLDALFDSSRGAEAPHPFYLSDTNQRNDVVTFLRSLGTN